MKRRLLTIKYDGSRYCGWQVQPNGVSIQSCMQSALKKVLGFKPDVTGCSRTDAGVHANMFCLHFDSDDNISDNKLPLALNFYLPYDISVISSREVPDCFHARYSSRGKNYIYKIHNSAVRDPFNFRYSLSIPKRLDETVMNAAALKFCGTHDFAAFCSSGSSVSDTVRTVSECSVSRDGDDITVSISANGFLYNMVRIVTGTLIDVGSGKIDPDDIPKIIASCNREMSGPTVKPNGLFLNKVFYNNI